MAQAKRQQKVQTVDPDPAFVPWTKPRGLSGRGWLILGAALWVVQVPLLHRFLRGPAPVVAPIPYEDTFDQPEKLKANYWSSGGHWRIVEGQLLSPGVKNNPLWLKAPLPRDVAVEFDVRSESQQGDIKVEIFGDGYDHASGYVLIHGGWDNKLAVIARLDEHGAEWHAAKNSLGPKSRVRISKTLTNDKVVQSRVYHWRIERKGNRLTWSIDGQPYLEMEDPFPLEGKGHDRFGFSSWDANLYFDNLKIQPL